MVANSILFLQEGAPAQKSHIAAHKIRDLVFKLIDYPSHSPDLAPSDSTIFQTKRLFECKLFQTKKLRKLSYSYECIMLSNEIAWFIIFVY